MMLERREAPSTIVRLSPFHHQVYAGLSAAQIIDRVANQGLRPKAPRGTCQAAGRQRGVAAERGCPFACTSAAPLVSPLTPPVKVTRAVLSLSRGVLAGSAELLSPRATLREHLPD